MPIIVEGIKNIDLFDGLCLHMHMYAKGPSIKKNFQADMVLVCHVERSTHAAADPKDWFVKSAMNADTKTRLVVLFTQGDTDIKDVKKHISIDNDYPVTNFPNAERRMQSRQIFGYAYPVLDSDDVQTYSDLERLPKKVKDRVDGLLPKHIVEELTQRNAQLYAVAKAPKTPRPSKQTPIRK